jgi:hypothetical protein
MNAYQIPIEHFNIKNLEHLFILQNSLHTLGYVIEAIEIDLDYGFYGESTKNAVMLAISEIF